MLIASGLLATLLPARSWDYEGHRTVNLAALSLLPKSFPDWARTPEARERIAFLSGELDRWRNTPHSPLRHDNHPDHYFDLEDLPPLELTLTNLPPFRYEFVAHLARLRATHPERFRPVNPTNDLDRIRWLPGFLPWSIAEDFARLKSAFSYLKAYETSGNPTQVANARANVVHLMGVMGHAVGDATQPLHSTIHYNGWVGPNPNGYLTQRTFHAWIDGGYLRKVGLQLDDVLARTRPAQTLRSLPDAPQEDPVFRFACRFVGEQFERMEPLYAMEKAGKLSGEPGPGQEGKPYLLEQLARAANTLADLWLTAYEQAPPDRFLLSQLANPLP